MENFTIEATKYTPKINLNAQKRIFNFSGKSYPENTFDFYSPVIKWIETYFESTTNEGTKIDMDIIYFNSSSSKLFFDFFDILEEAHQNGHKIEVNWFYDQDNESAYEAGEDFQEDFENLPINLVEK